MKRTVLKDLGMFALWIAIAGVLFATIGSRTGEPDQYCVDKIAEGLTINCENRAPKGWPVTYIYADSTSTRLIWPGLLIDTGAWLIVGGVLVFGVAMVLPEKKKK